MMRSGAHLRVDDLRVTFRDDAGRDLPAVDGVSFALPRGATLGIVGESGSGKSTVARALLGFARPGARFAGGGVRLGETDVLTLAAADLRAFRGARAAMVPQNPLSSLTPHRPIGRQLTELIRQKGATTQAAAEAQALALMDATGLPDPRRLIARYPHELSGGQRQRVVIAAALVAQPELIVLDEPTTALDKTVEAKVLDLVARIQTELNATLVYVSHDLNVVAAICQHALIMRNGRVEESGPTRALFDAPKSAYAQALVRSIPRIDALSPRSAPAAVAPALIVDRLRFSYHRGGWRPWSRAPAGAAVEDVSFAVRPGETLGVLGESGSGKSTIAGLLAGVLAGHGGTVTLDGAPVTGPARRRPLDLRRRIQMVFQDPLSSLNPAHSVAEIVARPLRRYFGLSAAAANSRAAEILADLEIGSACLRRRPRQLSGGQQQRVAIARALAAEPQVLICDEITSALDVTLQAQVLALLKRLQADRGLTMVFISHDLAVVADVADQILVLERGRVRDYGARDRVLTEPAHPYCAGLLSAFRRGEVARPAAAVPEPVALGA